MHALFATLPLKALGIGLMLWGLGCGASAPISQPRPCPPQIRPLTLTIDPPPDLPLWQTEKNDCPQHLVCFTRDNALGVAVGITRLLVYAQTAWAILGPSPAPTAGDTLNSSTPTSSAGASDVVDAGVADAPMVTNE